MEKGTLGMFSGDSSYSSSSLGYLNTLTTNCIREKGTELGESSNFSSNNSQVSNVFELSRKNLLDHIVKWKAQLLDTDSQSGPKSFIDSEAKHNLPVSKMGEYLPHIMKTDAMSLRDIHHGLLFDDTTGSIVNINNPNFQSNLNRSLFGNPFRSSDKVSFFVCSTQCLGYNSKIC